MHELALLASLYAGLRRGEVLALTWKNIDLKNDIMKINRSLVRTKDKETGKTITIIQDVKTKSSRRILPIHPRLKEVFLICKNIQEANKKLADKYYDKRGFVFATGFGNHIGPRNYNRSFYAVLARANLNHTNPHSLRHTFATRLLEANVHPKIVQELLGHAQIETTMNIYSHVMNELKAFAIRDMIYRVEPKEEKKDNNNDLNYF